ncbi:putative DNA repair protein RAD50 [Blattamonas nauphoetae]|uniref:DNA repair protein RAD50 n=1 Tax=Blattamonas nauphoetae TaxID=2049346 RepID=A0ABQ9XDY3_9EUKA|nr:putative DNA repair protein RAD50 [Blattamonas nauphoetae]
MYLHFQPSTTLFRTLFAQLESPASLADGIAELQKHISRLSSPQQNQQPPFPINHLVYQHLTLANAPLVNGFTSIASDLSERFLKTSRSFIKTQFASTKSAQSLLQQKPHPLPTNEESNEVDTASDETMSVTAVTDIAAHSLGKNVQIAISIDWTIVWTTKGSVKEPKQCAIAAMHKSFLSILCSLFNAHTMTTKDEFSRIAADTVRDLHTTLHSASRTVGNALGAFEGHIFSLSAQLLFSVTSTRLLHSFCVQRQSEPLLVTLQNEVVQTYTLFFSASLHHILAPFLSFAPPLSSDIDAFTAHPVPDMALSTDSKALSTDSKALSTDSKALSTDSKALSTDSKALSTDSKALSTDSKALSTDSKALSTDSKALSTDSKALSTDSKALSTDSKALSTDSKALSTDSKALSTDSKALSTDSKALSTDSKALSTDSKALSTDSKALSTDSKALSTDSKALSTDSKALSTDSKALSTDSKALSTDSKALSTDSKALSTDSKALSTDSKALSTDSKALSTDSKALSTDSKALSTDSKALSTDSKALSTDSKALSTDSKALSTDSKALSTDSKALSTDSKALSTDSKALSTDSKALSTDSKALIGALTSTYQTFFASYEFKHTNRFMTQLSQNAISLFRSKHEQFTVEAVKTLNDVETAVNKQCDAPHSPFFYFSTPQDDTGSPKSVGFTSDDQIHQIETMTEDILLAPNSNLSSNHHQTPDHHKMTTHPIEFQDNSIPTKFSHHNNQVLPTPPQQYHVYTPHISNEKRQRRHLLETGQIDLLNERELLANDRSINPTNPNSNFVSLDLWICENCGKGRIGEGGTCTNCGETLIIRNSRPNEDETGRRIFGVDLKLKHTPTRQGTKIEDMGVQTGDKKEDVENSESEEGSPDFDEGRRANPKPNSSSTRSSPIRPSLNTPLAHNHHTTPSKPSQIPTQPNTSPIPISSKVTPNSSPKTPHPSSHPDSDSVPHPQIQEPVVVHTPTRNFVEEPITLKEYARIVTTSQTADDILDAESAFIVSRKERKFKEKKSERLQSLIHRLDDLGGGRVWNENKQKPIHAEGHLSYSEVSEGTVLEAGMNTSKNTPQKRSPEKMKRSQQTSASLQARFQQMRTNATGVNGNKDDSILPDDLAEFERAKWVEMFEEQPKKTGVALKVGITDRSPNFLNRTREERLRREDERLELQQAALWERKGSLSDKLNQTPQKQDQLESASSEEEEDEWICLSDGRLLKLTPQSQRNSTPAQPKRTHPDDDPWILQDSDGVAFLRGGKVRTRCEKVEYDGAGTPSHRTPRQYYPSSISSPFRSEFYAKKWPAKGNASHSPQKKGP